jgi:hypothetical protein
MREIFNVRMLSVRAGWLVVLGASLVLPVSAQAQFEAKTSASVATQSTQETNKTAEKPGAAATAKKPGGLTEGLQVHGHWVIDVRNPDGGLAAHREFENEYEGQTFLAKIMSRQYSVGFWCVGVQGNGGRAYVIAEPLGNGTDIVSQNLTVSGSAGLVLSGSYTATVADNIGLAYTLQEPCLPTFSPTSPCSTNSFVQVTGTTFSPVSTAQGQIVQVTVTITFS